MRSSFICLLDKWGSDNLEANVKAHRNDLIEDDPARHKALRVHAIRNHSEKL